MQGCWRTVCSTSNGMDSRSARLTETVSSVSDQRILQDQRWIGSFGRSRRSPHRPILAEQTALKKQKEAILQGSADANRVCTRMKQAEQALQAAEPYITEWNETMIRQLVERVTVLSADEVLVRIKGGAEIRKRME